MWIDAASLVATMKVITCAYRDELPERNERTFGHDDRQEWSTEFDRKNT